MRSIRWKFDLKALMKAILQSNAYQRSSRPLAGKPRRAPVLFALLSAADDGRGAARRDRSGDRRCRRSSSGSPARAASGGKPSFYPPGTRAIQLSDAAVESYFLQAFGRNPRRIVCECDRSEEPTVVQVLHLSNGNTLNDKLKAPGNRIEKLIDLRRHGMSDAAMVDELYLTSLARYPTADERNRLVAMLPPPGSQDERAILEDMLWGLLSSREFLFNH